VEVQATLERAAADPDRVLRAHGLELWLLHASPELLPTVAARALWDPDPWVQRRAVHAVADRLPLPAARAALLELALRDSARPDVACAAALAVAEASPDPAVTARAAALAGPGRALWRRGPCALAALAGGDPAMVPILDEVLREGAIPVDLPFVEALGRHLPPASDPALLTALDEADELMALPLMVLLLERAHPRGEAALRAALEGEDPELRDGAVEALSRSGRPEAVPLLRRAAEGADPAAQLAQIELAVRGAGPAAPLELALAGDDADLQVEAWAAIRRALARGGEVDRAAARLAERHGAGALRAEDPAVRAAALRALAALEGGGPKSLARERLADDEPEVALAAAEAVLRWAR
jgi:hypothetical protein